jgi:formylglycine-generating enzyme required for sulfatase activity
MRWLMCSGPALLAGCAAPRGTGGREVLLDLGDSVTMEVVRIPAGSFLMGSKLTPAESVAWFKGRGEVFGEGYYKDEHPRHRVHLKPFLMGEHEVTVAQFRRFVEETGYITDAEAGTPVPEKRDMKEGSRGAYTVDGSGNWILDPSIKWRDPGLPQSPAHPVVAVSWNDAQAFCRWLSEKSSRTVRLPTEAEWEYACRGGTNTLYWWGDRPDSTGGVANLADQQAEQRYPNWAPLGLLDMDDGYLYAAPVGSYAANPFGLHDMLGNVFEWCEDIRHPDYDGAPTNGAARVEPHDPERRVFRGGCWGNGPRGSRCASRAGHSAGFRGSDFGFRIVVDSRRP